MTPKEKQAVHEECMNVGFKAAEAVNSKPFPYWPPQPSEEELMRTELMMELNKWANNDDDIAQRTAETLILLLQKQFKIKPQKEMGYVQE